MGMFRVKLTEHDARSRLTPVHENMAVQRRLWLLERLGLVAMTVLVLLTLLGLFSKGLLSSRQASAGQDQVAVSYERFLRNGATSVIVVDLRGAPNADLPLRIEGELLDGLTVESITPPAKNAATFDKTGMQLALRADAGGQVRVHLAVRSDGVGAYRSVVRGPGGSVTLNQFIYP